MKNLTVNLTDLIIDAYERGVSKGRAASAKALDDNNGKIIDLQHERVRLVSRINELTTEQWEIIKNVFDKVYPNNGLSKEDLHDRFHQI